MNVDEAVKRLDHIAMVETILRVKDRGPGIVRCGECVFWEALDDSTGLCRHSAPVARVPISTEQSDYAGKHMSGEAVWPRTGTFDGCGAGFVERNG